MHGSSVISVMYNIYQSDNGQLCNDLWEVGNGGRDVNKIDEWKLIEWGNIADVFRTG